MNRRSFRIPDSELEFTFARSSGPGGQNVNKVSSKAVLRWSLRRATLFSPEQLERIRAKLGTKINREDELVISSDAHRDQIRNREACVEKLHAWIEAALRVPKKRGKTKPTRSSRIQRAQEKQRHSKKKRERRYREES